MAVPVPWSTAEEVPGERQGRRYGNVQVRCWRMAAVVRSAQVPGPEPGLGEHRGRCLWAREQEGGRELHRCASMGSSAALGLRLRLLSAEHSPEMDKDFNVC